MTFFSFHLIFILRTSDHKRCWFEHFQRLVSYAQYYEQLNRRASMIIQSSFPANSGPWRPDYDWLIAGLNNLYGKKQQVLTYVRPIVRIRRVEKRRLSCTAMHITCWLTAFVCSTPDVKAPSHYRVRSYGDFSAISLWRFSTTIALRHMLTCRKSW